MLGKPFTGKFHPVKGPDVPDWKVASKFSSSDQLIALTNDELAKVDPLAMNIIVAQEMPEVPKHPIFVFQQTVNEWASDFFNRCLPDWEPFFHESPEQFDHQLTMFRLGMITQYLEQYCQIRYKEALKTPTDREEARRHGVVYTRAEDLFLHGLLRTREGTCGNMAALQVAIGWRLGWPVSLACAGSHFVMRYDDGEEVFNIEASAAGTGGWGAYEDEYYMKEASLPRKALDCGSDLRAVTPREMLGLFIGLRARIYENTNRFDEADRDYLQARALFPNNRQLHFGQLQISVQQGAKYFMPGERSHPNEMAAWLIEVCRVKGWPIPRITGRSSPVWQEENQKTEVVLDRATIDKVFTLVDVSQ